MPRVAYLLALLCVCLLAPAWTLLVMVAGNGLHARQADAMFAGVGICLAGAAIAGPAAAAVLTRRWRRRLGVAGSTVAGVAAAVASVLAALVAGTFLLLIFLTL